MIISLQLYYLWTYWSWWESGLRTETDFRTALCHWWLNLHCKTQDQDSFALLYWNRYIVLNSKRTEAKRSDSLIRLQNHRYSNLCGACWSHRWRVDAWGTFPQGRGITSVNPQYISGICFPPEDNVENCDVQRF